MNARRIDIIAIHGVGNRELGDVLDEVMQGLGGEFTLSEKTLDGARYPIATAESDPLVSSIVEVNWDDLSYPARKPWEFLAHAFSVMASLLRVGAMPPGANPGAPAAVYRWAFMALLLWCIYPPMVAIGFYASDRAAGNAWIVAILAWVGGVTWLIARYDRTARAGYVWIGVLAAFAVTEWSGLVSRSQALQVATIAYGAIQGITGALLAVAMGWAWYRGEFPVDVDPPNAQDVMTRRIARLGLLFFPFVIISGVGALVWVVALFAAQIALSPAELQKWMDDYVGAMIYDLAFTEFALAAAVFIGAAGFAFATLAIVRDDKSGKAFHARVRWALTLFTALVATMFVVFALHVFTFDAGNRHAMFDVSFGRGGFRAPDVMAIYAISALRLAPFLFYLLPPVRPVLDILGDVALYLDRDGLLGCGPIRDGTRKRLDNAFDLLRDSPNDIVVMAHSQGTAIAADVLASGRGKEKNVRFVSLGSPIGGLYWRFLGHSSVSAPGVPWLNLYRDGDFIPGGEGITTFAPRGTQISEPNSLGPGRHSGYFKEPAVWGQTRSWLGSWS